MPPLTPALLSRSATDRLLDGGTGPEPLRQLIAAAAAPAQADELGGEQAARLAFATSVGSRPLPDVATHNPARRTRTLSWIVAAKAIAAIALTAGAGGVAVAATSSPLPAGPPDASTHQESGPDPSTARPTVVVDRARGATLQPDGEPAQEPSPSSPASAPRDGTNSGGTPTGADTAAHPDQRGKSETDPGPDGSAPTARPPVAPGNPQRPTGPTNGAKKPAAKTPPGQQKEKGNNGNGTAGAKKEDSPGNSDNVDNPPSDTAEQQQKAGQE